MSAKLGCVASLMDTVDGRQEMSRFLAGRGYQISLSGPTSDVPATVRLIVAGIHLELTARVLGLAPRGEAGLQTDEMGADSLRQLLAAALINQPQGETPEEPTRDHSAGGEPTPTSGGQDQPEEVVQPATPGTPTLDERPEPQPQTTRQRASLQSSSAMDVDSDEPPLEEQICLSDSESESLTLTSEDSSASE